MSIETNKAIVRRYYEEFWNAGTLEVADEIIHSDNLGADGIPGVASHKDSNRVWHQILPDIHFTLEDIIGEGDTVMVRWTARGTHQGDWDTSIGNVLASGKATITPGTSTYHLRDGKIIQDETHIDFVSLLQQMGARIQASVVAGL